MSKQAKAREFSKASRMEIYERDNGACIFCQMNYRMDRATWLGTEIKSVMHYIPRSKNGLGIPQNGAIGCQYHHEMLDNGYERKRREMLILFKNYLMRCYPDWNEEELIYSKWND